MQEPLRIVCVEHHHAEHGIAAQILTDSHLDFSWQCVASPQALSRATADFNPHIVLCTDDMARTSRHGLVDALRLLCSQTPVILVSSMYEMEWASSRQTTESSVLMKKAQQPDPVLDHPTETGASGNAQDPIDLRAAFSAILESSAAPAVITDAKGSVTRANTSACQLLSGSRQRTLATLLGTAHDQCSPMPHWLPVSQDTNPNSPYLGIGDAIPAGGASERSRQQLAYIDDGSLLPTLIHMDDLIGSGTASKRECREALALIAVDRDSGRIPACDCDSEVERGGNIDTQTNVPRYGSIVRFALDDFLVVLPDPTRAADAATTVHRLLDSIAQNRLGAEPANPPAGAAASFPMGSELCKSLLSQSSAVARDSKSQRRRRSQLRPTELTGMGLKLNDAVQGHSLKVQYQPQFDLKTGRGCGIEALARWTLPSGDVIIPSIFIPIAEREGMIHALGAWILKSACDTAYDWCSRDAQRTTLSVNVSALQIDEEFCAVIGKTLERSGFPAKRLELEITESALLANPDLVIECLKQWRDLGVRIAMDDFGTGDSSLSYLSRLPVDTLKLDQSLIHRMTLDEESATVTRAIVSLGAELGIGVVAEGVETEEQLHMLTDLGCPRAQGYLLARPMPAKQALVALRKTWGDRFKPATRPAIGAVRQSCAH